jgi:hypothetical protein
VARAASQFEQAFAISEIKGSKRGAIGPGIGEAHQAACHAA